MLDKLSDGWVIYQKTLFVKLMKFCSVGFWAGIRVCSLVPCSRLSIRAFEQCFERTILENQRGIIPLNDWLFLSYDFDALPRDHSENTTGVLKLVTPLKVQNFQIFLLGTNFSRFPKILDRLLLTFFCHKNRRFSPAKRSKSAIFFRRASRANFSKLLTF